MLQLTLKLLLLLFSTLRLSSCQSLNADSSEHFIFILVISHDLDFDGQLNEQWNRDFDNRAIAAEEANLNEYTSAVSPCFSGSTILKFYALPNNYPGSAYVARLAFSCEETLSGIEHGLQPIDVVSVSESDFGISSGSDTDTIKELLILALGGTPCENGGFWNGTNCFCPQYYYGFTCRNIMCLNGGYANFIPPCTCPPGYMGIHCEAAPCLPRASFTFTSTPIFNLIVNSQFDAFGKGAFNIFKSAVQSLSLANFTSFKLSECDSIFPSCIIQLYASKMTFTDQVNNVDLSDNPSTCELFRAFNAISQLLSDTPASQSPIFLITQQPPSDIDMEEKVIKQAVSWNARIFVIYIVPKAFQCPLDDFQPLVRLTQATNGQFIMIETNPDPKVFTSIMDTQFNSQTLNAAVADKCVLSLRVNRNPAGSPIYLAISASGSVPLMANGVLQSPLASADQNWRFFDLPTGTTSVEINATLIPCNVIIYTIASTSLFISFSNDNSVDTYAPYLIEGVPLSVTLHAELASSISATVDSAQFNLVASNGSNLATVPGEQRSNCSYEWIADMPACDRGNSKFLLHIDLQLTNGQMISRVFGVYCATTSTKYILETSSSALANPAPRSLAATTFESCNTDSTARTCATMNQQPGALDNNYRSLILLIEVTQSTPTITDKINSVLSITPMTNLMSESVVRLYILVFFGKNCGKTVVVTPDPDLFLDELKKAGNMTDVVCANGKPSATLQDAIIMAVAYLGPQKAFAYAILTSDVSQISDPSDVYSALQGVDLTLNIATLTPTPSEDALKVMQAVASATGGALFIFDSSAAPLQLYPHLRNTFVRLLSDLASTALYKIVKFDGENTPFSVESTYTELIVTYIDAGGGSGSIEIEPFDNTNSFTIVKDKYTTVMQFKTSNTTALNTVVPRTNCNYHAGCILIIQVIGGEQAVVRFTDLCDSDFPTARAVAGQSINAIVYLRDALADDGIHMLNLASGDLQRQTSVDYKNRTGCTFAYVATLTNLSPTSNWLVITGEEPSRSTFTKYIPFVIVDKLRCNNGGTLSENKCQCLPGWSEPDCSQVNCGREGTPNSQMTACTCLQNGFTGRFCDKSVTPSTTSTTSSTTTNPSSVSSTTAAISTTTTVTTSVTTSISTTTTTQTPLLSTTTTTTKSAEGLSTGVIVAIIVVGVLGLVGMAAAIGIALLLKSGSSGMAHGPSTGHGKGQRMWRSRGRMQRNPSQPRRNDGPSLGNGSQVGLWPWNGASGIQY